MPFGKVSLNARKDPELLFQPLRGQCECMAGLDTLTKGAEHPISRRDRLYWRFRRCLEPGDGALPNTSSGLTQLNNVRFASKTRS